MLSDRSVSLSIEKDRRVERSSDESGASLHSGCSRILTNKENADGLGMPLSPEPGTQRFYFTLTFFIY